MRLWTGLTNWIWNNLTLTLGVLAAGTIVAELLGDPSGASFLAMGAGTVLMMKAEAGRPDQPPPPDEP